MYILDKTIQITLNYLLILFLCMIYQCVAKFL